MDGRTDLRGAASDGVFTLLETIPLLPVDSDPENPAYRNFTTDLERRTNSGTRSSSSMPICLRVSRPHRSRTSPTSDLLRLGVGTRATAKGERHPVHDALMRVLKSAADEIDHEIGTADIGFSLPYSNPPAIARQVNLERAVEHWRQEHPRSGLSDSGATRCTPRGTPGTGTHTSSLCSRAAGGWRECCADDDRAG